MYCKNCGAEVGSGERFCSTCGTRISEAPVNSGDQTQESQPQQTPYFGQPQNTNVPPSYYGQTPPPPPPPVVQDDNGCLYGGLSFLFPVVGIILYFVWKQTKPNTAKICLTWALISIGINFLSFIPIAIFSFSNGLDYYQIAPILNFVQNIVRCLIN